MFEISATDDMIDSRNVNERFDELSYADDHDFIDDDEKAELKALAGLMLIGIDMEEWDSGVVLVHSTYFVDYVKSLKEETEPEVFDAMPDWVKANLDWDGIAEDMRSDFTVIEWQGETFYTM